MLRIYNIIQKIIFVCMFLCMYDRPRVNLVRKLNGNHGNCVDRARAKIIGGSIWSVLLWSYYVVFSASYILIGCILWRIFFDAIKTEHY